jgi:antirestriction protein ArdC
LPEQYYAKAEPRLDAVPRIDRAESFFAATGASIQHGGNQAFYTMAQDRVQMPPFETFRDAESYYATLAHEMTHNAVIEIMPHDICWTVIFRASARRGFGIIIRYRRCRSENGRRIMAV